MKKINEKFPILFIIFFAAVLFSFQSYTYSSPFVKKGILDLKNYTWNSEPIPLDGQWEFYYGMFHAPEDFEQLKNNKVYIDVPSSWKGKKINAVTLPDSGYATYRMRIYLNNDAPKNLSLLMPKIDSAYTLYINNTLILKIGKIGISHEKSLPFWKQAIVDIPHPDQYMEIVVHISNFYYSKAGITKSILLGSKEAIIYYYIKSVATKFFIFGTLAMISIYHLVLFLFKKYDKKTLYFGLFSFLMALLAIIFGEFHIMIIFPNLSWNLLVRVTYLTMSLGLTFFVLFLENLYPEDAFEGLFKLSTITGIIYTFVILFAPVHYFSKLLSPFHIIMLIFGLLAIITFARAIANKREDATLFFMAFIIYGLTIINDMLHYNHLINTTFMVPYGFLLFIILQSFILAKQNAIVHLKLEKLFQEKVKLENTTITLHNLAYVDSLTEIPNRRRFEEYLQTEWLRAIRNKTSISIIMIDIDHFKKYNDKFGHVMGDIALKKIAETIKSCIHRPADMVARYGGEEFIVILPETDIIGTYRIAEQIRKKILDLKIPAAITTSAKTVSVSSGCSTAFPTYGEKPDDLIGKADKKLYRAKKMGRNRTEK